MDFNLVIANALDKRKLINELDIAIKRYRDTPSPDNEKVIEVLCCFILKKSIVDSLGLERAAEKMEALEKMHKIIMTGKPKEN